MPIKLANNASGQIATGLAPYDIGLALVAGQGATFPSLAAGEYFYATLASAGGSIEIVKVTAKVNDTFTIVRAQEGTTALSFSAGARFELRVTAQSVRDAIDDVTASAVTFTPYTSIASTDVQSAIQEVVDEINLLSTNTFTVEVITATEAQTVFNLSNPYVVGATNLSVYMNGLRLRNVVDYVETNSTRVTLTTGAQVGDELTFVAGREVNDAIGASSVSFVPAGTGAVARTAQDKMRDTVSVKDFGAVGDGVTDDTAAIQAAILALRAYPADRIDTIGGNTITMYRSGTLFFPPGVYRLTANTLQIVADMGLTFQGAGSRRFTNAIYGRTTLLITGASSGYGIQFYRNGARSAQFRDIDICYESNTFTGHLIDCLDAPGLKFYNCYLGTYGITAGTRYQTAASLLRLTYDEDVTLQDCTLDGAVLGVFSDDTRTELGNTFGGWGLCLERVTFYDITTAYVQHAGNRTRTTTTIKDCHFNPINMNVGRAIDLNNLDGLSLIGNIFSPSTTYTATTEWARLVNVTGTVTGNSFGSLSKSGTFNGQLEVSGNVFAGTDGVTLAGGVITGRANEFSTGTNGWTITPTQALVFDVGPDWFKSGVTNSIRNAADSANIAGNVRYDSSYDSSTGKFSIASGRIRIENVDRKQFSVSTTPYTLSVLDTGRTVRATGASAQTFTLPAPQPGCVLRVFKASSVTLQINGPAATSLYAGTGGLKTSISAAAGDIGGWVTFESWDTYNWIITSSFGVWTLA